MNEAFLLVRSGGRQIGLPVSQLLAVAPAETVVPVPASEPALAGVSTVRGETTPVLRLAALVGSATGAGAGDVAVLVRVDGVVLCIEVDDADTVVRAEALPLPDAGADWARGVIRHEGAYVPILDLGALSARLFQTGQA